VIHRGVEWVEWTWRQNMDAMLARAEPLPKGFSSVAKRILLRVADNAAVEPGHLVDHRPIGWYRVLEVVTDPRFEFVRLCDVRPAATEELAEEAWRGLGLEPQITSARRDAIEEWFVKLVHGPDRFT
jgi:hypothetical protein